MRNYLRELRANLNLSQEKLAEKIGISQQYYNLIEHGERQKDIGLDLLQRLSSAFGVPIEQLIEAETQYKSNKKTVQ